MSEDKAILRNRTIERAALKVISKGLPSSKRLLARLDESFFGNTVNLHVYRRIKNQIQRTHEIPSWRSLQHDPSFDDTVKTALISYKEDIQVSRKVCDEIFDQLATYRRRRLIDKISRTGNEGLLQKRDDQQILDQISQDLIQARANKKQKARLALGANSNYKSRMEKIMSGEAIPVWPTGLREFDERGGGIAVGSLILIGGPTGFGKTALMQTIDNNFADFGLRVGEISLEMDDDEVLLRRMSSICSVPQDKILRNQLTPKEKEHIRVTMDAKIKAWGRKDSGVFVHTPDSITMEGVIAETEAYDYHVVSIDYISLMEGMGGKDFWQKLQEGCRLGKLDAKRRKGITIILVQTSKEDELRLSTLMMTHADYAMFIKYSPDSDEEDFVDITMPKARKIKKTPFTVGKDLAYARFINYDKEKPEKVTGPGRKVTTDKPIRTQGGQKTAQAGQKSPQIERSQIDDEIESYFADKDNF